MKLTAQLSKPLPDRVNDKVRVEVVSDPTDRTLQVASRDADSQGVADILRLAANTLEA